MTEEERRAAQELLEREDVREDLTRRARLLVARMMATTDHALRRRAVLEHLDGLGLLLQVPVLDMTAMLLAELATSNGTLPEEDLDQLLLDEERDHLARDRKKGN